MAAGDFVSGSPKMVPHTPAANVAAGASEVLGNTVGITCGMYHHAFLTTDTDGEIAVGGGIYKMTPNANIAAWAPVALADAANNVVSSNLSDGPFYGYATEALVNTVPGNVLHDPVHPEAFS